MTDPKQVDAVLETIRRRSDAILAEVTQSSDHRPSSPDQAPPVEGATTAA